MCNKDKFLFKNILFICVKFEETYESLHLETLFIIWFKLVISIDWVIENELNNL